ncbi:MAG: DUF504 domain-containing protein [Lentisphaeria bacterium]|nr:DUF504 domain-containing protein [Lentisphaeria bacterium]
MTGRREVLPIRKLLDRIRWDDRFGAARFEIAWYDRAAGCRVCAPLEDVVLDIPSRFAFRVRREGEHDLAIPYHRVREVRRNGEIVWTRAGPESLPGRQSERRASRRPPTPGLPPPEAGGERQ